MGEVACKNEEGTPELPTKQTNLLLSPGYQKKIVRTRGGRKKFTNMKKLQET